jgi:hypothetical protein
MLLNVYIHVYLKCVLNIVINYLKILYIYIHVLI